MTIRLTCLDAYDEPNYGWPTVGNGWTIGQMRTDGYTDGYTTIQGVRTYDGVSTSWTTPDAFAGTVDDPMMQRPYMWNNNNPIAYADPTGFCSDPGPGQAPNGCLGGVDWNLNMRYGEFLQKGS